MADLKMPTSEEVGEIVAYYMAAWIDEPGESDPLRFIPLKRIVTHIGRKYRIKNSRAERLLFDAVKEGTVVALYSKHEGAQLSRVLKNTMDTDHELMEHVIEGLDDTFSTHMFMDYGGVVRLTDTRPMDDLAAPDDEYWITTPKKLARFVETVNAWVASKRATWAAEQVNKNHTIHSLYGEALDHVNGMLVMAGLDSRRIHIYFDSDGQPHLDLVIRNGDEINAIGRILKEAGIWPDEEWRKRTL